MRSQMNIFEDIIIDFFAGGGGASTGIELALGKPVTIAINHDKNAILMHKTNHPYTKHYQEDVWKIKPQDVCMGRHVGLAWFSPDCKHFSKAKGAALVDKKIRGLAWVVLRWAAEARPDVILLENVEEFQTWGPVKKGKPIKSKSGCTFQRWLKQLRDLGYKVEHRELSAADYGAPTTRKRLYLIARCDGKSITWPAPTHSKNGEDGKQKWRSAAEIIDWSIPGLSIFETKEEIKAHYGQTAVRPLADNTLQRIIRGVDKFTIKSGKPFIVPIGYGEHEGQLPRIHDIDKPVSTIVSSGKQYLCTPSLIQYHGEKSETFRGQSITDPIMTVDSSNRYGLTTAQLTKYFSGMDNAQAVNVPLHTVTSKDREALTLVHIAEFKGQDKGQSVLDPLRTITASAGEFGAVYSTVEKYNTDSDLKYWPKVRELLNKYCGYNLSHDDVLLMWINGMAYFISDIGLRMLVPKELYAANGFPHDYIIDHDYTDKAYSKKEQVARCGNAVCPPVAKALIEANYSVRIDKNRNIETMQQLNRIITAV